MVLVDEHGQPVGRDPFSVYPCNKAAADLFFRCATQWRRKPLSDELAGLDYAGVEAAARLAAIEVTPETFEDLQLIEAGALGASASFEELDALQITHVEFSDG